MRGVRSAPGTASSTARPTRSTRRRDRSSRSQPPAIPARLRCAGRRPSAAPPDGFAVQLVYTHDRSLDEAIQVHDGDVVLVPRGYHPVAAGPGYDLYYLNVMAGPTRRWLVTTDPDHRWQLD